MVRRQTPEREERAFEVRVGMPVPLGVSREGDWTNFALFSLDRGLELLVYHSREKKPFYRRRLEPSDHRTGDVWHIAIKGLPEAFEYGYLIGEPDTHRDPVVVLDPYSRLLASSRNWGDHTDLGAIPHRFYPCRSAFAEKREFDWQGVRRPMIPLKDLMVYEVHVRGFTQHASGGVQNPGKFLGMVERLPYLKELGVNALELMPIFEFNEREYYRPRSGSKDFLLNYWGYSTVNFYSPMNRYGVGEGLRATLEEFKILVRECHRNGIEVILDVVFNHTAEGNRRGPKFCYKPLANSVYYMLGLDGSYLNFSGCGNTVNANHSIVIEMIIECLRYWATETQVDGFRFDLASLLTRDYHGEPLPHAALTRAIACDPILSTVKLIAEPWDPAGLYQVGSFGERSPRWSEWNDTFRDTVRKFLKGTDGVAGEFAKKMSGSPDVFAGRAPLQSINFITCHDGFTLRDLVTYNHKHNEENGEHNRDGHNNNLSWNCGEEGPSANGEVNLLRMRQMRNFIVALLTAQGVPMFLMGDEYGHTKNGNNNTWCQDNERSWFLWNELDKNEEFYRFVRLAMAMRQGHKVFHHEHFLSDTEIVWHGLQPYQPSWEPSVKFVCFELKDHERDNDILVAFNASHESQRVELPPRQDAKRWCWLVNTGAASPMDIVEMRGGKNFPVEGNEVEMLPYSSFVLKAVAM